MSLLTMFQRMLHQSDLQEKMMEKLNVRDVLANHSGNAAVFRRSVNRCMSCTATARCENFLDDPDSPAVAPSFCRNGDLFDRLQREIKTNPASA